MRLEHATSIDGAGDDPPPIDPSWPKAEQRLARSVPGYAEHLHALTPEQRRQWFAETARGDARRAMRQSAAAPRLGAGGLSLTAAKARLAQVAAQDHQDRVQRLRTLQREVARPQRHGSTGPDWRPAA